MCWLFSRNEVIDVVKLKMGFFYDVERLWGVGELAKRPVS